MSNHFRTEIKLKKGEFPEINYGSNILLIGSCFSDNIGKKFQHFKFSSLSNPFGVTYNPISISNQLRNIANDVKFTDKDIVDKNGLYNSFELHGSFDNYTIEGLIESVNKTRNKAKKFLEKASHVYITLGTAWIYELIKEHKIVNNCHKFPSSHFSKRLLSAEEISTAYSDMVKTIMSLSANCQVLFTISPVRHLKDGFQENSLSKSLLRIGIENVIEKKNVRYFPSFEIANDDLRDYRFYSSDLVHPNQLAIDYLWSKLVFSQVKEETQKMMKEVDQITRAINHKPFMPKSENHIQFINNALKTITDLQKKIPEINFSEEIENLENQLPK